MTTDDALPPPCSPAVDLNRDWLFGGRYVDGSQLRDFDDSCFTPVTLPHTVTALSWADWDPDSWQDVWIYRRHLDAARPPAGRIFVDFDGVLTDATVYLNGVPLGVHHGGYLPWSVELTGRLAAGDNVLAVAVDSRWLDVPPCGAPGGAASVDYLQPGGIYRDVTLRTVPDLFLRDVFVKPVDVLGPDRRVEVQATIDAADVPSGPAHLAATLWDGPRPLAAASAMVPVRDTGPTPAGLRIADIPPVALWSPEEPKLYLVEVTLSVPGRSPHTVLVRTGFRAVSFRVDGCYLNGRRHQLVGLNRHQLFPYLGMAAGWRLQRADAAILRRDLNCTIVRCSHYPPSPHFLDACDELGLMVWEEAPGWQYVGGRRWQDIAVGCVRDMVLRDRNRPSVVLWGTRLNETADHPGLYARTRRVARTLDGTRPTTGAMTAHSTRGWAEDVFGYDDYSRGRVGAPAKRALAKRTVAKLALSKPALRKRALRRPLRRVPYLVSEAVGALSGAPLYRWTDPAAVLAAQALLHARVHEAARADRRHAGLIGWCAVDYASHNGGERVWRGLKWPGVLDTFRVAKPAAAIYRAQVDPAAHPVILPVFYWDFGARSPADGPGPRALVATNCERLEVWVGGRHVVTGTPDRRHFGHLPYPPVVVDLMVDGTAAPELRIDGYLRGRLVATRRMSADPTGDRLKLVAGGGVLVADGGDATGVTFRAVDAYGNRRPHVDGDVRLSLSGPGRLIGDNPFPFGDYGGVGGIFVRSLLARAGDITVTARHETLGDAAVRMVAVAAGPASVG